MQCSFRLSLDEIQFLDKLPGDNRTDKLKSYILHGRAVGYFGADKGKTTTTESLITRVEELEKFVHSNKFGS